MGKKIDRFVLTSAAGILLYLYFRVGTGSSLLSVVLALTGCILLKKIIGILKKRLSRKAFFQKRMIRREASGAIMRLACRESETALQEVRTLLKKHYGLDFHVRLLQAHPSERLTPGSVFNLWKENRGADHLVICATCPADAACKAVAASLKSPKIALVDSDALARLIAEHPEALASARDSGTPAALKMRKFGVLLFNRRSAPKNLLLAGVMAVMYYLSANPVYLLGAAALLTVALLSLRRSAAPEKLF